MSLYRPTLTETVTKSEFASMPMANCGVWRMVLINSSVLIWEVTSTMITQGRKLYVTLPSLLSCFLLFPLLADKGRLQNALGGGKFYGYPYCWSQYNLNVGTPRNTQWAWPDFINQGYTYDSFSLLCHLLNTKM